MSKDYVLHYCGPLIPDARYEWLCFGVSSMRIQVPSSKLFSLYASLVALAPVAICRHCSVGFGPPSHPLLLLL
jgi:hypothetical protein